MGGAKLRARTRSQYALAQPTAQQLAPVILRMHTHMHMHMHMLCACICTSALLRSARRSSLPASSSGRHRTENGLAAGPAVAPAHRTWLE